MSTHALYTRGKSELGIVSKLNSAADAGVCLSTSWARICKCSLLDEKKFCDNLVTKQIVLIQSFALLWTCMS